MDKKPELKEQKKIESKPTIEELICKALSKKNPRTPKHYYQIAPDRGRSECLLWGYHRQNKYFEVVGRRHKSLLEFRGEEFLATGRIFEGRGSVLFNKEDIQSQRMVANELQSRYPMIKWWVFTGYCTGAVVSLGKHMGDG